MKLDFKTYLFWVPFWLPKPLVYLIIDCGFQQVWSYQNSQTVTKPQRLCMEHSFRFSQNALSPELLQFWLNPIRSWTSLLLSCSLLLLRHTAVWCYSAFLCQDPVQKGTRNDQIGARARITPCCPWLFLCSPPTWRMCEDNRGCIFCSYVQKMSYLWKLLPASRSCLPHLSS